MAIIEATRAPELTAADIDPRVKAAQVAWTHIESEYRDVVQEIIDTLVPDGPYAYTLPWPYPEDDSIPYQHFAIDMPTLRASYEDMHRYSVVRGMEAIAEVRGDWYAFCYGLGEGAMKGSDEVAFSPTAVIFPTMGREGITGELIWRRVSRGEYYTGGRTGSLASETALLARHELYLDALRKQDAAAAAALHHPGAQIGVCDYLTDSGTIAPMHSADEYRVFLEALFERFDIIDVQVVHRVVTNWIVFAELVWVVNEKRDGLGKQKFFTVDMSEVLPSGLFASRIGHGTVRESI